MDRDQAREMEALEGILLDPSVDPIKLSYGLLKFITDNFSKENEIGRGGYGVVYKGYLENEVVAVKVYTESITNKQFMDEIECLKSANHRNIVRFLGYCAEKQEEIVPSDGKFVMAGERYRLLCFEYVSEGNIREYLERDKTHGENWLARYEMIRGICQGLKHLHDNKIYHRDLKPENVMLDANMEAKITDFGLSRFLHQGESTMFTMNICGTMRYIAPEVIDKNEISFKSDIYALGIIIIELLTGVSMISLKNWDESLYLLDCRRVGLCVEIARNCTDAERENRPTIHEIIRDIDQLESMIPKPSTNQVTYTVFPGTELLDVHPSELRFAFEPEKEVMSCHLTLTNKTNGSVYCMIIPKDPESSEEGCEGFLLPPMFTVIIRMDMTAAEEISPVNVEWEILMYTTVLAEEVIEELKSTASFDEDMSTEDVIEAFRKLLWGDLHRASLTAVSVAVSEGPPEVRTLGQEEEIIPFSSMDMHPTEPWVLLTLDPTVHIWNWQTNEKVGEYDSPDDGECVAKFIAREQWVVIGKEDGSILVHRIPTMDHVKEFEAHFENKNQNDGVSLLAVHPTRPFLLSCSKSSLKLWDWRRDWSCTRIFDVTSPLSQLMFNPNDPGSFATLNQDGLVQMWRTSHRAPVATTHNVGDDSNSTESDEFAVKDEAFTYSGGGRDFIAILHDDSLLSKYDISIRDLRQEELVHKLTTNLFVDAIVCHPTHAILVIISRDKIVVWDTTTYRVKKVCENPAMGVLVNFGFTGSRLVMGYRCQGAPLQISVLDIELE